MDCAALDAERTRLLAERDDLTTPSLSSNADTGRDAKGTQLNGKLYTVAKAQFDKGCPTVANGSASQPVPSERVQLDATATRSYTWPRARL